MRREGGVDKLDKGGKMGRGDRAERKIGIDKMGWDGYGGEEV